jgi:hypothetical protein
MSNIIKTKEYDIFKNHPVNRELSKGNLKNLIAKIRINNQLDLNPVIVTDSDDGYYIANGQHRIEAAKHLDIPFYYIYKEGMSDDDVRAMNVSKHWRLEDHINSYLSIKAYEDLKLFAIKHDISESNAGHLLSMRSDSSKIIKLGLFEIKDISMSESIMNSMKIIKNKVSDPYISRNWKNTRIMRGMINISKNKMFSFDRFNNQLNKHRNNPKLLWIPSGEKEATDMIIGIYNYRISYKNRISKIN